MKIIVILSLALFLVGGSYSISFNGGNENINQEIPTIANDADTSMGNDYCKDEARKYSGICQRDEEFIKLDDKKISDYSETIKSLDLNQTNCKTFPTPQLRVDDKIVFETCHNGNQKTDVRLVDGIFYACNYWRGE